MQFDIWEVLIILGMVQSLYVIVHLTSSAKIKSQILIPVIFFINIFCALLVSFAYLKWGSRWIDLQFLEWGIWSILPMTATLFTVQLLKINKVPAWGFWVCPALYLLALISLNNTILPYENSTYVFEILAVFGGSIAILLIWILEGDISDIRKAKNGDERFWVVVSLLLVSAGLMAGISLSFFDVIESNEYQYLNIIMALAFAYLGATSLFRIYPYPVELKKNSQNTVLNDNDVKKAKQVEDLLHVQKVYQEQGYNRANLAREVELSEAQLTKIVKAHFHKNVPSLLNELRVEDAKSLLRDTKADITTIAYESGFNSLATFNRVFKDITGVSPSKYREK